MFRIQVAWFGVWVSLPGDYPSRDEALWAVARWRQANGCTADPFCVVEEEKK